MNRTNIYLTDEQRRRLDARARAEGVSRAELIRSMLDRALDEGGSELLDADLAAIDGSFAALTDELSIDRHDGAREAHLQRLAQA
jgi:metal-responsive CopG/Arc/MetJ family transcriptional regulator